MHTIHVAGKGFQNNGLIFPAANPKPYTSEKESTRISLFVHPSVHVITCSSSMWLEIHASTEEFTCFFHVRTPLVTESQTLFSRGQKDAPISLLIHAK
jgi:hypothetical protein